jgi:hypothetical protein
MTETTPTNPLAFDLTLFSSIFRLEGVPKKASWADLVAAFAEHLRAPDKTEVPGFGPYVLHDRACDRPRHPKTAHRCDVCVDAVSLAVFDVDCGTYAEVEKCDRLLEGHARLWYSSHSYRPEAPRPSLRLIVPLARPVEAERWASWRANFIQAFHVPADPKKCGGLSHFYYAPSCPPDIEPVAVHHEGPYFDPDTVPSVPHRRPAPVVNRPEALDATSPEDERLHELRVRLSQSVSGLKRSSKPDAAERRRILEDLLAGRPLATHGSRNQTTTRVVFDLVRRFEDLTLGECLAVVEPSLLAMQSAGSRLNSETVGRMYETAHFKLEAQREADARIETMLRERLGLPPL